MNIGKKIRELRLMRRMKMTEVAKHIEVSVSTYRDWEYGRKIPIALSTTVGALTEEKSIDDLAGRQKVLSLLLEAVEILQKI